MREKLFTKQDVQQEVLEATVAGEIAAFGKAETNIETGEKVTGDYRSLMPAGMSTEMEIDSPYYQKWIEARQLRNPLLGKKYFEKSYEDCVDDKVLDDQVELTGTQITPGLGEAIDSGDFDNFMIEAQGSEDIQLDAIDTQELIDGLDNIDDKLLDISIITNVVNRNPGLSPEELAEKASVAMQDYYHNAEYKTLLDLFKVINKCKTRIEISKSSESVAGTLEYYKDIADIGSVFTGINLKSSGNN
jgi:hypothetical protein